MQALFLKGAIDRSLELYTMARKEVARCYSSPSPPTSVCRCPVRDCFSCRLPSPRYRSYVSPQVVPSGRMNTLALRLYCRRYRVCFPPSLEKLFADRAAAPGSAGIILGTQELAEGRSPLSADFFFFDSLTLLGEYRYAL
jgi:hypothetical protein